MRWSRVAGSLAVLSVVAVAVGSLVSFVGTNDLFLASARRLPALATTALVALGLAGIVRWGRSGTRLWTPYW